MKGIRGLILTLAGALVIGAPAYAAPITLTGGTAVSISGGTETNEFIPGLFPDPQIGGYYGTQISLSVPLPSTILVEFFGAEAGFHNEFNFFGSELFDHPGGGAIIAAHLGAPLGTFQTQIVGSGLLPFSFDIDSDAGSVANGANPAGAGGVAGPNFFATCNPFSSAAGAGGRNCGSVYLFLDDDGGAFPDDDYDDFLVRITVVPEPATLALLGLALLGLAGRRVRASRHS